MATAIEKKCPECYWKMPDPEFELEYFMWSPGFEWKPPLLEDYYEDNTQRGATDEDMAEALAEMVEENEMKQQFNAVANGASVDVYTAADLARKLGLAPSNEDIRKYEQEAGLYMDYRGFQKFMAQCTHPEDNVQSMAAFFAYYDTQGTGYLTKKQFCNLLGTWGEPLTDSEINAFIKEFSVGEKIDYVALCEKIMEKK